MDLRLTQEQERWQGRVREFARKEVLPFVPAMEEEDRFPREIVRRMGRLGLMGVPVPQEYGGAGLDFTSYIIAIHELAKVSASVAVILSVHVSVVTNPILHFGNEEQKRKFLPRLAAGEWLGAFALTEAQAGSDAAGIRTAAIRDGDAYILNGTKLFITSGGEADLYLTLAVTDPGRGAKGISAFLVKKGTPGFRAGKKEKKMGLHGSSTAELIFEEARVPAENRLGREGEGFKIAMESLNAGRIGIAAQALGIAEAAFEHARRFARERMQSGKPLAEQQAIAFKLADMATRIEAARLLVYRAAGMKDAGSKAGMFAAMAKRFASDVAMEAAAEAVQIFGECGCTKDYSVERLFRDAKITQIYEGTNQIQRLVIAKSLINGQEERK